MKTIATAGLMAAFSLTANAAPIIKVVPGTSNGGGALFTFEVDPNGAVYDTINFEATATVGAFTHQETATGVYNFVPGSDDSDILGLPTIGSGLSVLGNVDSPTIVSGVITTFGGVPTTSLNGAFAQVVVDSTNGAGFYAVSFAQAGNRIHTTTDEFAVPEPASLGLIGAGALALVRRRRLA